MKLFKNVGLFALFNINRSALKPTEKTVLIRLIEIYESSDSVNARIQSSYSYIGDQIDMDRQAVSRAIKGLIDSGIIQMQVDKGQGNLSTFIFMPQISQFDMGTGKSIKAKIATKKDANIDTPSIKNDMTPSIKNDMTPSIKNDMTPSIKNDMTPSIKNEHNIEYYLDNFNEYSSNSCVVDMRACVRESMLTKIDKGFKWSGVYLPAEDGYEKVFATGEHFKRDDQGNKVISENGRKNKKLRMMGDVPDYYVSLDSDNLRYNKSFLSQLYQDIGNAKKDQNIPHFLAIKENTQNDTLGWWIHKAIHFTTDKTVIIEKYDDVVNREMKHWLDSRAGKMSTGLKDRWSRYDVIVITAFNPLSRDVQGQVLQEITSLNKKIIFLTSGINLSAMRYRGADFSNEFKSKTRLIDLDQVNAGAL
jgi:hypothetical protein